MKKTKVNFYLEIVMLIQVLLLGASGWTMEHMFSCGKGGECKQGPLQETFLWLGRHDWGEIHSFIAVSLLTALAIHLVLHWNWIKCRIKEIRDNTSKGTDCETTQE
jgi:Domain of unknown function (DUF4405)